MTLKTTVLFDQPQHELVTRLRQKIETSQAVDIVTGFATVEGVKAIEAAVTKTPKAIRTFVVGAGTYQAYRAFDQLIASGVPDGRLFVHLGHTRPTGQNARHRFYRYHPMLHSKVYYFEHADGSASAFIGSHNLTGFALTGLNGEAGVLIEGPASDLEFGKVREHIDEAKRQAVQYTAGMQEAYSWWTHQFIEGLRDKTNDTPRDGESAATILILAEGDETSNPRRGEVIYFELPLALGSITSLKAEVHVFVFSTLPPTPRVALASLNNARASYWCRGVGLERERGGTELQANWVVNDHRRPVLAPASQPFRPRPAADMQQVRTKVHGGVNDQFEYLFGPPPPRWVPVFDGEETLVPDVPYPSLEGIGYTGPNPENGEWQLVRGLAPAEAQFNPLRSTLARMSPEGESFVLVSMRRRPLQLDQDEE